MTLPGSTDRALAHATCDQGLYGPAAKAELVKLPNCTHLDHIRDVQPSAEGCEDCLAIGADWVHLRECLECGHVGCCDSSPNTHATKHFHATKHPIIMSFQPGESWKFCYVDQTMWE